ncbi:MAG: glycosyltransferase [Tissierellales bacterium]|nr:glycosyltransferase [Tissierellales bacterium]
MKIMYIKAGNIDEKSGGGLESAKILHSLKHYLNTRKDIHIYVVSRDRNDVKGYSFLNKKKWKDILSRALFHSSYAFVDLRFGDLLAMVQKVDPDIVILGNSRLGFMVNAIKKKCSNTRIIVHFDNVEYDYVDAYFANKKEFKHFIYWLEKFVVRRDEKSAVGIADFMLLLTKRDRIRLSEMYGAEFNANNFAVVPICLEEKATALKSSHKEYLVFTGSLWYEANCLAVLWFLENIWDEIKKHYPELAFKICGSNPSKVFLEAVCKYDSVAVYPNYKSYDEIFCDSSIFISPIQEGAGMKVKVAEALSLGLPIIASRESLIGYEEALADPLGKDVIFKGDTVQDYIEGLKTLLSIDRKDVSKKAKEIFRKYYTIKRGEDLIAAILDKYAKYNDESSVFDSNIIESKPLVSVIMPVYNSQEYLREAIDSVREQTYENWEIIAINDGSSDKSIEILNEYKEANLRIIVIDNNNNFGVVKSRNIGIQYAKGDWIAFLDSDDLWAKDKLEKQLIYADKNNSLFVFTDIYMLSHSYSSVKYCSLEPKEIDYKTILKGNMIALASVMIKKEIVSTFPMEREDLHEDYILWMKVLRKGYNAYGINQPLTFIRIRENSRSSNKINSVAKAFKSYRYLQIGILESLAYTVMNTLRSIKKYTYLILNRRKI